MENIIDHIINMIRAILEKGADVNAWGLNRETVLHMTVSHSSTDRIGL